MGANNSLKIARRKIERILKNTGRVQEIKEKNSGSAKRTPLSKNRDLSCGWQEIEKRIKIVGEAKVYI